MLASRQNKQAVFLFLVCKDLKIREELGNTLDFVKNRSITDLGKKTTRIGLGKFSLVWQFQIDVFQMREGHPTERGLSGLPRPGHGHKGILSKKLGQAGRKITLDHDDRL